MSHRGSRRIQRLRRKRRVRATVQGTSQRPRFSVFRSNRHISAQLIDDVARVTLVSASDLTIRPGRGKKGKQPLGRRERAEQVGTLLAEKAKAKHIRAVQFDRGRYRYHGRVAAVAAGARKGGLTF